MESKKYILEGVFTQFDLRNRNNGRIYYEKDFLPYIKKYNRKSKIKNILNELH